MNELRAHPERGKLVRTLDFSAFTSVGLGRSGNCNTRIELLTATTLNECLLLCPNVEELFLSEAMEDDISAHLLSTIFLKLPRLLALDFCAADSPAFCFAFNQFLENNSEWDSDLLHLSLHNCSTMPPAFFEALLPHFRNLSRLDLYNTQVTDAALLSLPLSCQLSVLNLSQCTKLSAMALYDFIVSHPVTQTLKSLSLLYSWNKIHPFSDYPQALDAFIQYLPRDMEVLDLAGLELDLQHLQHLPPSLIELGAHEINVAQPAPEAFLSAIAQQEESLAVLPQLQYLLLTTNTVSEPSKLASILIRLFPQLSVLESPGFTRVEHIKTLSYRKISGAGRRDWIQRQDYPSSLVESNGSQWHPRKSNMSLTHGAPRSTYDYYSYRV